jgi:glycosyltransferase involved in cell wall biosynthesis
MVAYSVIIPAYNEENYLPRTLDALQAAMAAIDRPGEIIVVENNSSDATAEIARRRGARVVFEKINQISRARNAGAAHARAEYLLFVDADTLISAELLGRALDNLQQEDCCGGGATVSPDRPLEFFYQIGLHFWNRLSVRFGMAAGSFVYCRKEGFEAVGGFSQKVYVGEEIWFSINYGKWGKARNQKFKIIDQPPVVTSTRKLDWYSKFHTFTFLLSMMFFPFISRYRFLCRFWYRRPSDGR